ncbi:MAG: hypothetical protein HUK22_05755, partial [Thermoguttaceae bacterium]|nr:hypothetical protein [Thermoguttaceae bacterium]
GEEDGETVGGPEDDRRFLFDKNGRRDAIAKAICAKIAQKVGDRNYLDDWAKRVAKIAESFRSRLVGAFADPTPAQRAALAELKTRLEYAYKRPVSDAEILEAAKSHFVASPVFDAFFKETRFTAVNPVAAAFQKLLDAFADSFSADDLAVLADLRAAVALQVAGIRDAAGRQEVLKNFYEKFFKEADPKAAERLGVVYTPEPVVDFILKSVDWVARKEFGKRSGLASRDVRVLDPFTGTGTFIARLVGGDLIKSESALQYAYARNLWANEISLLPYYIAAANIETEYAARAGKRKPFPGIVLADTFNATSIASEVNAMGGLLSTGEIRAETEDDVEAETDNDERLTEQRKTIVEIIV